MNKSYLKISNINYHKGFVYKTLGMKAGILIDFL